MKHLTLSALSLPLLWCATAFAAPTHTVSTGVNTLRCEDILNPVGLETRQPHLSWQIASNQRGWQQGAYRILVASTPQLLAQDKGDLWDSGKVTSDNSVHIPYEGKLLTSRVQCYWKVRVWDTTGKTLPYSAPAAWEMGLLYPTDWHGSWLGYVAPPAAQTATDTIPTLDGASWLWYPEGNPRESVPAVTRYFRRTFTVPAGRTIQSAQLRYAGDNTAVVYVNGQRVGQSHDGWKQREALDVQKFLAPGNNVMAVSVENESAGFAGLIAKLEVRFTNGDPLTIVTDGSWKSGNIEAYTWRESNFDDANWASAQVLAPAGSAPWGALDTTPTSFVHPAPYLRRTFALNGKIKRATAYICGLGLYELHLNGRKVGDHVLDPAWTSYDKHSLYATYDVTSYLKSGGNALGVILGTGHYDDPVLNVWDFENAAWRARPRMLLELRVDYTDGRQQTITSDDNWKASTGPILFDSLFSGENYDARLEKRGWDEATYNEAGWQRAQDLAPVPGALVAQVAPAIKETEVLKPVKITQVKPGVWIYDMGQNFAGVPQLRLTGPAGTKVVMRSGEKLYPDGTLNTSNIDTFVKRRDKNQQFQTDTYILKGGSPEVWQPRFTYHGYQYLELTGFPGTPTLDAVRGIVVHSAIPRAGTFECSNPLLNQIQHNTLWSYRNNFHGLPTDCPQREKNGWTGDAQLAAEMGLYNFDPAANYHKWLDDIHDAQRPTGALPGIVPSSGWGYDGGPSWDSAYPLIVWYLYNYRNDQAVVARHYAGLRLYVDYVTQKNPTCIVYNVQLGDWLPAKTKTPTELTSTAYYYVDSLIVAQSAALLGNTEDARTYTDLAARIKRAFNEKFFNPQTGQYANGSLTANSCALYQGLVEPQYKDAVVANLVSEVKKQDYHMDVGILGSKYLLNALAQNGHADIVYQMLMQKTAPSYGAWIAHGATTLWETWNVDEANNSDASHDHVMFGDVSAWFYKYLAGITSDAVGFRKITLKPHVLGDLTYARATYNSIQGPIVSDWKIEGGTFQWQVTVPANTTATVYVPAQASDTITESGKPISKASGVRKLRYEDGYAVFAVVSGTYQFAHPWKK